MTRLISPCSGVRTRRNDRAPAVIWLAKLSDATFSATYRPVPLVANEPLNTSSPGRLGTTSLSPVSCDSSTPIAPETSRPSSTTWSPASIASRSPRTRSSGDRSIVCPSRTTVAVGRVSSAMRSRVRLARTSWTMPTTTLVEMTLSETSASIGRPTSDQRDAQGEQDVVDEREHVLAHDLGIGARGRRRRDVAEPGGTPSLDLGRRQPGLGRGRQVGVAGISPVSAGHAMRIRWADGRIRQLLRSASGRRGSLTGGGYRQAGRAASG